MGLSIREQQVLDAIINYKASHDGVSPTVREISQALGYKSGSWPLEYLDSLQQQGLISYSSDQARSIQVLGGHWQYNRTDDDYTE